MAKKTLQRLKKHAKKTHARKDTRKKTFFIEFRVIWGGPGDPQNAQKTTNLPEETGSGRLWDDFRASGVDFQAQNRFMLDFGTPFLHFSGKMRF